MRNRKRTPIAERFQRYVSKAPDQNGCILWTASKDSCGYGKIADGKGGFDRAHRVSWRLATGSDIPNGLGVLHRCDVRACVNPAHLFLGNQAVNMHDCSMKGRINHKGERNSNSKLTEEDVLRIREAWKSKAFNQTELGKMYGVTSAQISTIVNFKQWRHINGC